MNVKVNKLVFFCYDGSFILRFSNFIIVLILYSTKTSQLGSFKVRLEKRFANHSRSYIVIQISFMYYSFLVWFKHIVLSKETI